MYVLHCNNCVSALTTTEGDIVPVYVVVHRLPFVHPKAYRSGKGPGMRVGCPPYFKQGRPCACQYTIVECIFVVTM